MPYVEKEIEKLYYSIGSVASMFNVATAVIRYWEVEFEIKTKKTKRGFRQYMKEDIETIRKIHHLLKVELYTIPGARKRLKEEATV